ncbi:CACTA en-spm transposon protein [Cucumis melo var. makuwa]|uniref:CACTA en-spm transposon protein n=1 Tax=Cucumis melo var. makuwa TaxID=1194695 RepID=A0A5A7T309_CUCMM|nr:CACTA en-spm transposon protein [Cucumis melo var. makuwa]TYJ97554.1 CACTA en-spm transposon protein [Cucumis melo var. makuwa]
MEERRWKDEMSRNIGVLNGWSNKSFDMLLEHLIAAFSMCSRIIPSSFYEAKRKLHDLGLGYETIHAYKYVVNSLIIIPVIELRESENLSQDFFLLAMRPSFKVRCYNGCIVGGLRFHMLELDCRCTTKNSGMMVIGESDASYKGIWDVPEVDDVENEHLSVLEIIVSHQVDEHIKNDTLCRTDVDPTIVQRSIVRHVTDDFIDVVDENLSHSRLLKLERYVAANSWILMTITPNAEKLSPHAVHLSQAIGVCVRKKFLVCYLKWADVGREYIEVVKGDLQHELPEQRMEPVDCVELFWQTHVRDETFVSQAAEDPHCLNLLHHQMLELQSQSILEGSQSLSEMRYVIRYWVDDQTTQKTRNHEALVSEMERMRKLIEDMTWAQQGPPHDP